MPTSLQQLLNKQETSRTSRPVRSIETFQMDSSNINESLIDKMNRQHKESIISGLKGMKIVKSESSLPCDVTKVLNKYPGVPDEIKLAYRMKAFVTAMTIPTKSIESFAKDLEVTLSLNGGNWIAPVMKTEKVSIDLSTSQITLVKLRKELYFSIYQRLLKDLKDPLYAFRATIIHAESIDQFCEQFKADLKEVSPDSIYVTEWEIMKISRELINNGSCYGYIKHVVKQDKRLILS